MNKESKETTPPEAATAPIAEATLMKPKRKGIMHVDPSVGVMACKAVGGLWRRGVPYPILRPGESLDQRLKQTIHGQPTDVPQLTMVEALEVQRQHRIIYWEVMRDAQGEPILRADGSPKMRQRVKDTFEIVDIEEG